MTSRSTPGLVRRALLSFVRADVSRVYATLALALGAAAASAAEPLVLKTVLDHLAGHGVSRGFALGVAGFTGLILARILATAWIAGSTWRVRLNIEFRLRSAVAAKVSVLSSRTQAAIGTGGLRHAIDSSAPETGHAFTEVAFRLVPTAFYFGLAAWGMARLDPALTVAVCCLVPLPVIVAVRDGRRQAARDRKLHAFWRSLWAWYTEVLHGLPTVRAFARERAEEERLVRRVRRAFSVIHRTARIDARGVAAAGVAETVAKAAVLGYGGLLVARGELTVGALLAFLGYVAGLFAPVQGLAGITQVVRKALVALEGVFHVLDSDEEAPDLPGARPAPRLAGHVVFEDVCFSYRRDRLALDRISFTARPGETIALVGPSGSGKSTVLRLLQRTAYASGGRVLVDGHDVRELEAATLRRQLGVVPQDVVLFNDTVRANLAYGRPRATQAEIEAAATAANAHDFIVALPDGYATAVGEGGRALSGGQRQRLAIARAFLVNPAVLILDEATAALDTESEFAVQKALRELRRDRTTLVVAHRLNTVRDADRIIVLRDGRIVGAGTHDELIADCPTYAALVRHQLGDGLAAGGAAPRLVA